MSHSHDFKPAIDKCGCIRLYCRCGITDINRDTCKKNHKIKPGSNKDIREKMRAEQYAKVKPAPASWLWREV